jgi:hypothetical protein
MVDRFGHLGEIVIEEKDNIIRQACFGQTGSSRVDRRRGLSPGVPRRIRVRAERSDASAGQRSGEAMA